MPVRWSPKASSQGTSAGRISPKDRRFAASSCSVAMWKYGFGNTRFMSGATGFPVSATARTIHGAIISACSGGDQQHGFPAALRSATKRTAPGRHRQAGELDGVTESGEHAGRQQIAMVARQQKIECREQEEDARGIVVGRRTGDTGHRCAEIEDRGNQTGQVGSAQAAAEAENQREWWRGRK